ncbi:MAG: A/G-specific adenine glycosylase [Clostridia bacterium]|nr:MAG: A/G-specific adenine glycosylase [Clostridia bacterium]
MRVKEFRHALLAWYDAQARVLPWREHVTPYHTWISEIMLQQTQVNTVIPYYQRFLVRFPDVSTLAAAPLDEVLKLWEGLGYYRRVHNLYKSAKIIVEQHNGKLPENEKSLLALPGIGRYTAGAIRSIAFGKRTPVLDGNVKRVLARVDDIDESIDLRKTGKHLWARAAELTPSDRPGDFNQAMMELGATICLPREPACNVCPVTKFCKARARGVQTQRPVRTPKKRVPHYHVAAGVVWHAHDANRFLIAQRPAAGMLGGLWEFPGGKQEAGESLPQTLKRELKEELAIKVIVGEKMAVIKHAFTHFRITLHAFHAQHLAGQPQRIGVDDWRWVTLDELDAFAFPKTDRQIIAALQKQ